MKSKSAFVILMILIIALAAAVLFFVFLRQHSASSGLSDPTSDSQEAGMNEEASETDPDFHEVTDDPEPADEARQESPASLSAPIILYGAADSQSEEIEVNTSWFAAHQEAVEASAPLQKELLPFYWAMTKNALLAEEGNLVLSPQSLLLSLSALARMTGGESRQQILRLLGQESPEDLQFLVEAMLKADQYNTNLGSSRFGNLLLLDGSEDWNQETLEKLAEGHQTTSILGAFGSEGISSALKTWRSGFYGSDTPADALPASADDGESERFELYAALLYRSGWDQGFEPSETSEGTFIGSHGDQTGLFMKGLRSGRYFPGERFQICEMPTDLGDRVLLVLPTQGVDPDALLEDAALYHALADADTGWQEAQIDLSLPRFSVSSDLTLNDLLIGEGITDLFDAFVSDFSPLVWDRRPHVYRLSQSCRLSVDENGLCGAAETQVYAADSMPNASLVFDRPFLVFVLSTDNALVFSGRLCDLPGEE